MDIKYVLDYALQYPTVDGDRDDLSGYISSDIHGNSPRTKTGLWPEPHLKSPIKFKNSEDWNIV